MDQGFPASLRRALFGTRADNIDKNIITEDQKKYPVGRCKSLTSFQSTNKVNYRATHLSAMARLEDFSSNSQNDDDSASVMFNDQDCVLLERVAMKNGRFIFSEPQLSPDSVESDSFEQSGLTSGSQDVAKTTKGSLDDDGNSRTTPVVDNIGANNSIPGILSSETDAANVIDDDDDSHSLHSVSSSLRRLLHTLDGASLDLQLISLHQENQNAEYDEDCPRFPASSVQYPSTSRNSDIYDPAARDTHDSMTIMTMPFATPDNTARPNTGEEGNSQILELTGDIYDEEFGSDWAVLPEAPAIPTYVSDQRTKEDATKYNKLRVATKKAKSVAKTTKKFTSTCRALAQSVMTPFPTTQKPVSGGLAGSASNGSIIAAAM